MLKFFLFLTVFSSLLFSSGVKANGCDLSQVGDVQLSIGGKNYEKVTYRAIVPSGKNFRTIFVGSTLSIDNTFIKITDIKANKRIKGKPRTGVVTLDVNTEKVLLTYNYDNGSFKARGIQKNSQEISFALEIKALFVIRDNNTHTKENTWTQKSIESTLV